MSSVTRGRLDAHRFTSVLETVQCDPLEIKLVFFLFISVRKTHIRTRSSEVIVCVSDLQLKKKTNKQTFSPLLGLNVAALNTSTDELR